jgi:hypothetical protein
MAHWIKNTITALGGAKIRVRSDCRLSIAGVEVTLRPRDALLLSEALVRSATLTAVRESALSVEPSQERG